MDRDALRKLTAPALLAQRARTEPRGIAYRAKHLGLYQERTWAAYASPPDTIRIARKAIHAQ